MKMILIKSKLLLVDDKELKEIYDALCCLNISIRAKQKKRAIFIQQLIKSLIVDEAIIKKTKKKKKEK